MRFGLQDVKKSIQRRGGTLTVSLHFLQQGEGTSAITRLIAYHESLLGQAHKQFSLDEARALVADYRLASCLLATLSHWYVWRSRAWSEAIEQIAHALPAEISSSVQLRLALYTYVNEHYHGFLDIQQRTKALSAFAAQYQLQVNELEYLLALDSEDEAVLTREQAQPPEPDEVATLYNQWAFEAALFNASQVRMVIDCQAFARTSTAQGTLLGTGVGAVIKRLCFLARKLGVYYDLAYNAPLLETTQLLTLTLYGPQEVTGTAQQYGLRLARLCKLLLGYATLKLEPGRSRKSNKATLAGSIVEANATVHFLHHTYDFAIDAHVLQAIQESDQHATPTTPTTLARNVSADDRNAVSAAQTVPYDIQTSVFDSSIEQSFAEAFMALARSQGVDGWRLEREPEPLLLDKSIFIPDFALTRAQRRIYVEILGFWTPAYRERKVQKLLQLRDRNDILLAIPLEAKEAFTAIAASFPIVYYSGQLSATEVIQILRLHYDDFAERLASIDSASIRLRVLHEHIVSERSCYEALQCYRRSELLLATEHIIDEHIAFLSGLGLYDKAWMAQVEAAFFSWMQTTQRAALSIALTELRTRWQAFAACEDAGLEALLARWPGINISRSSIFDATVELIDAQASHVTSTATLESVQPVKKQVRERRAATKKHVEEGTKQQDLWA